jgi:hypothetical protein
VLKDRTELELKRQRRQIRLKRSTKTLHVRRIEVYGETTGNVELGRTLGINSPDTFLRLKKATLAATVQIPKKKTKGSDMEIVQKILDKVGIVANLKSR